MRGRLREPARSAQEIQSMSAWHSKETDSFSQFNAQAKGRIQKPVCKDQPRAAAAATALSLGLTHRACDHSRCSDAVEEAQTTGQRD